MANEATIQCGLFISRETLQYNSNRSFTADISKTKSGQPGNITATPDGVDIDLSTITSPGLVFIHNLSSINYIELGVYNPDQLEFYPLIRVLPEEAFVFRLSPLINEEYAGTGTGTTGQLNSLRIKSANTDCEVRLDIFET